jgi:hypothetical protein
MIVIILGINMIGLRTLHLCCKNKVMKDDVLLDKISKLPEELKGEVADFVDYLMMKNKIVNISARPVFGSAKGMFLMQPGFDEPLEDFKGNEYYKHGSNAMC